MAESCYVCGAIDRELLATVDPKLRICDECDSAIRRRTGFAAVKRGLDELREYQQQQKDDHATD